MSALRWTCKSLRRPAAELEEQGHPINHTLVGELLTQQKFSLQANSKTKEGGDNPDRDAQFCHIKQGAAALVERQPVISVDTKKKELVGAPRVKRSARHMQQCLPQLAGLVVSHTLCHLVQPLLRAPCPVVIVGMIQSVSSNLPPRTTLTSPGKLVPGRGASDDEPALGELVSDCLNALAPGCAVAPDAVLHHLAGQFFRRVPGGVAGHATGPATDTASAGTSIHPSHALNSPMEHCADRVTLWSST
jgi:hypothetical protein